MGTLSKDLPKLKKLGILVDMDGDAGFMFSNAAKISPDFDNFTESVYNDFVLRDLNSKTIDKYGVMAIKAGIEIEKLAKATDESNKYNAIVLNGIILAHGYLIFFNQTLDEGGIVERKLVDEVSKEAKKLSVSSADIFMALESSSFSSIETKRYFNALNLLNKKSLSEDDLNKLYSIPGLFDDLKLQEANSGLKELFNKLKISSDPEFLEFMKLFELDYFPLLQAVRLLKQTSSTPNRIIKEAHKEHDKVDIPQELREVYASVKFWKGVTGLLATKYNMMLYFEILDKFAKDNKIELYSPIRKFMKAAMNKSTMYKEYYTFSDLNDAKMEFEKWRDILGYRG